MVFSSVPFLFAYLPVVLTGYLLCPGKLRNIYLFLFSLLFYFSSETWLIWIMLLSVCVDYCCALWIHRDPTPKRGRRSIQQKVALLISLSANLGLLFYFKYSGFFVENINALSVSAGLGELSWTIRNVALPMGISFYTFQSMSYTIDVYAGRLSPTRNFVNFATYVTLFPQLVAGPIVRYRHVHEQLVTREHSVDLFISGIKRFIIGLAKKVLIADTLAKLVDPVFSMPGSELTMPLAWLGVSAFALQLYFDFSGYSDMAIGLGRMLGFKFHENFKYPYVAQSYQEFWRRWHISMTTWFRDYVFLPLTTRRLVNVYWALLITFLLCGIWHGASWNFILFGFYSAFILILERWRIGQYLERIPSVLRHAYTILLIIFGAVLFRSSDLGQIEDFFSAFVSPSAGESIPNPVFRYLGNDVIFAYIIAVIGCTPVFLKIRSVTPVVSFFGYAGLFIVSCAFVVGQSLNPFLYFRF